MSTNYSARFRIWILAFGFFSSVALADPAQDLARAEAAYNSENLSIAMQLFLSAAKQGYAPAQVRLGEILYISEYYKDAVDWYRKAAEQGNAAGQYSLGGSYARGEGIEQDNEKALYWTALAAEKDHLTALRTMAGAYRLGELGLPIDLNKAKLWETRADYVEAQAKKTALKNATKTPRKQ